MSLLGWCEGRTGDSPGWWGRRDWGGRPGSCLVTGSPGVVLENSACRFLLLGSAILDVSVVWSAEITLEVDVSFAILALQSQG